MRRALLWCFFLLATPCFGQLWNNVLSSPRAYDWQHQAGIQGGGGIPSVSWPQCSGGTIAPYGSSGSYASPSTIISAVTAQNGNKCYVLLGNGDFYLSSAIQISGVSGVELRGGGPTNTRLHFSGTSTCASGRGGCVVGFQSSDTTDSGTTNFTGWTANYAQGGTTITLASGSGITGAGQMLVLDQCDDGFSGSYSAAGCSGTQAPDPGASGSPYWNCQWQYNYVTGGPFPDNPSGGTTWINNGCSENGSDVQSSATRLYSRGQEEFVTVVSCSVVSNPSLGCGNSGPTVVTIQEPLIHPNWNSSQFPQAWWITPSTNVGIRGININASNLAYSAFLGVAFNNVNNFWVTQSAFLNFANSTIFTAQSNHGQIESNYIYDITNGNPGNDSSGLSLYNGHTLVDNNIKQLGKIFYIPYLSSSGNVIAYNYTINANTGDDYFFTDCIWGHSSGADYNLLEGNIMDECIWDQTHGMQVMNSAYRNFFTGYESCANGQCGSNTAKHTNVQAIAPIGPSGRYSNIIGNVLGTPNIETLGYAWINNSAQFFNGSGLGYVYNPCSGNQAISNAFPIDPYCAATQMRWGNYDVYNAATQWNTSEVPSGISQYPNSVPTAMTPSVAGPASFYLSGKPSWWPSSIPFPAIGPDVSGGNVGMCNGTFPPTSGQFTYVAATNASQCDGQGLTAAWAGHVNANAAMACYLAQGGNVDGTSSPINFNPTASNCYGATGPATCPAPTILPGGGTYSSSQSVTMTDSCSSICWTNDGSTPTATTPGTCSHGTTYSGTITVSSTQTLNAIATQASFVNSSVSTAAYSIVAAAATPTFSPGTGTYTYGTPVTISTASSGCGPYIYWSSSDNPPTTGDNNSTSFNVLGNATIYAIVIGCPGFSNSAVGSATYTVSVATPTFAPSPGVYPSSQTVSLATTTSGATICYRTDGGTPTAGTPGTCDSPATTYSTPISVSSTTTIKTIGTKSGAVNSSVATGTFTITAGVGAPTITGVTVSGGTAQ